MKGRREGVGPGIRRVRVHRLPSGHDLGVQHALPCRGCFDTRRARSSAGASNRT